MEINTEHCHLCDGIGYVPGRMEVSSFPDSNGDIDKKIYDYILCPKCRGTGKIDWVRKITGSFNYEYPPLEDVTKEVRELMKEDTIFGTRGIVIEDERRKILKEIQENENKQ